MAPPLAAAEGSKDFARGAAVLALTTCLALRLGVAADNHLARLSGGRAGQGDEGVGGAVAEGIGRVLGADDLPGIVDSSRDVQIAQTDRRGDARPVRSFTSR